MIKLSKEVLDLLQELFTLDLQEMCHDGSSDDSVIYGCQCGCGGCDIETQIEQSREDVLEKLSMSGFDATNWFN